MQDWVQTWCQLNIAWYWPWAGICTTSITDAVGHWCRLVHHSTRAYRERGIYTSARDFFSIGTCNHFGTKVTLCLNTASWEDILFLAVIGLCLFAGIEYGIGSDKIGMRLYRRYQKLPLEPRHKPSMHDSGCPPPSNTSVSVQYAVVLALLDFPCPQKLIPFIPTEEVEEIPFTFSITSQTAHAEEREQAQGEVAQKEQ